MRINFDASKRYLKKKMTMPIMLIYWSEFLKIINMHKLTDGIGFGLVGNPKSVRGQNNSGNADAK